MPHAVQKNLSAYYDDQSFQEPPQGLTKNPPQKSLPKKKIILKKQKHIQYFNTWDPQYPTKVVCKKCNHTYSKSTGIKTKLNFPRVDPWPKEEMLVRDQALVEWITVDLQPFSVATNDLINTLDPRYCIPGKSSIKEKKRRL
ncbi:hypothetical protein RhiirA4_479817 [Rhizophagus irregularis]|uniref:BED-type domain-containing protein n=1 Tax=Rhizophagus irregularis TaxID=588596 RepID=A0A2I1HH56_9GLOM|nr:hypothetical protein RhiirA4_479817 [Rhizophagus irregularis]